MGLFNLFGTYSEKEVKRVKPIVDKINGLEAEISKLSDEELKNKTTEFKKQLEEGKTLDDILPEAFAVVREASKRVLGMRHFDVQLIGGIILHQGRIAEMKTGEGKTLVATLPVYLNALTGKGVHVITVNDYLAKRDSEWMGKLYKFLGLSVGLAISQMEPSKKREAYNCDITYGTNNEFGFDYLRDNMVIYKEQAVQRGLNYAIVDEIDSILIDEARTPLIISGQANASSDLYKRADNFVSRLTPKIIVEEDIKDEEQEEDNEKYDYIVDLKAKSASLTAKGIKKAEEFFRVENFNDLDNSDIVHHVNQALRAHGIMKKDIDYIVKDGEVLIVDEFTGRIMPGRRFSDGLHQAIEAKEHVKIKRESKTMATITFQNFFNKYEKKAGMTGTALTEEQEFRNIYGMDVIEVPTNEPVIRKDWEDAVYKSKKGKLNAVVQEVIESRDKGQPVLIGTKSIEASEELSNLLRKNGVEHRVLNAKFHEQEAEIVAEAGIHGKVTIATNMAGRGTDIKLDDEARAAGGLKIIGTERHDSRRIDNQLRGRSGRQGDPGESRFYISLEDDIMRLFGSERMIAVFNATGVGENDRIEHKMLSNAIEKAQKKIENNNYGIRKNLLEYDQVMNEQREIIYKERRRVLDGENMRDVIYKMLTETVEAAVDMCISDDQPSSEWNLSELNEILLTNIPIKPVTLTDEQKEKGMKKAELCQSLKEEAVRLYEAKEAEFPEPEHIRELERVVLLKTIDKKWLSHIDDMDQLRQGIGLQAYGQKDPLVEYRISGFDMFDEMTAAIREETVKILLHVRVEQKVEREEVAKITGTNKDESLAKTPKKRAEQKIYPNDPCPCGSGKKYKQCCGRKVV